MILQQDHVFRGHILRIMKTKPPHVLERGTEDGRSPSHFCAHTFQSLAVLLHEKGERPGTSFFLSSQAWSTNVYQTF